MSTVAQIQPMPSLARMREMEALHAPDTLKGCISKSADGRWFVWDGTDWHPGKFDDAGRFRAERV